MKLAQISPEVVEWINIDACISETDPVILWEMENDYGFGVSSLGKNIIWSPETMPLLLEKYFGAPSIDVVLDANGIFEFSQVHNWHLDSWYRLATCMSILGTFAVAPIERKNITNPRQIHVDKILLYLREIDKSANVKRHLKSTILGSDSLMAYCHLMMCALDKEHFPHDPRYADDSVLSSIKNLATGLDVGTENERAMKLFLCTRFASLDRYCKHLLCGATGSYWSPHYLSPEIRRTVNKSVDGGMDFYEDRLYLLRFRFDGGVYIADHQKVKYHLSRILRKHICKGVFIDIMLIEEDMLYWVDLMTPYASGTVPDELNVTGHFPILADFESTNRPVYIANHFDDPTSLSLVTEGDAAIQYEGENGTWQSAERFVVLCLRHDPVDTPASYFPKSQQSGGMDPTGPARWFKFWPEKDAEVLDKCGEMEELVELENFMDDFSASTDPSDTRGQRKDKFYSAVKTTDPVLDDCDWFWGGPEWDVRCIESYDPEEDYYFDLEGESKYPRLRRQIIEDDSGSDVEDEGCATGSEESED
ncbi:hypothetical protein SCHPADRAFT_738206 [Schizopora paradoxa]|uniref:Uncharacterized protein n=1 Tax=Schizopora paradoxa TaxID=27342 RepID=A0A0H2R058_9AGAM|nr:hypothetical protein SCHPADRAFT_738206 [Schizopora paradoxa]